MASISGYAKADEADLVGQLTPVIRVGDEEDTVAELIEWTHLRVIVGNFFRTCSDSQGGDYLYLLPDLAQEKKYRRLGDDVSLEYVQGIVKDSRTDGFCCYLTQFDYGMTLPLSNLAKSAMNWIGACPAQLNCNFWEVIIVCETLNGRWAVSGSERRITAKDFLEYYAVKNVTVTDSAHLSSSSSRPCIFDLSLAGRVWNDNLLCASGECLQWSDEEPLELNNKTITKGINYKVLRKESFIDVIAREGTELKVVLKELEISRFKRIASKDVATVSSIVVRNLAKRKAVKRGAAPHSVTSVSVDDSSKRRKVTSPTKSQEVLEESNKVAKGVDLRCALRLKLVSWRNNVELKLERRWLLLWMMNLRRISRWSWKRGSPSSRGRKISWKRTLFGREEFSGWSGRNKGKLKEVRAESEAEGERLVTTSAISQNNLTGKLYQLRYAKAEIMAFSEGNYEEMEIMDEEVVEEREDGLNVSGKTAANNQETINRYEDRLDDNVKLSLKLEEAKRQVQQKTATILSRDLALNQLTSELAELKEKATLGSRHEAELAENSIRALNEEIFNMKCNIRALNEQLLKREIELDTARTNLAVSEADFEKLSSSIMGKDQELRNSAQIRDSLIAKLDRVKAYLRYLKGREAQSRTDLAEIQAKNKSLVDDLAHARGSVGRAVQREKEMNKRINQFCTRISESERELRAREMKYQKDLKFELDKRDGEIASGEGSREMMEFLH
ncbi:hypothetical protein GIB67_037625 [Kingdonia uniflora]|uniref:Uncharacterized protein n=1 Tax=Kingdonia uniflora TaxID=39325 RepID=A0A7J7LSS9_9MAGN|nr:hypothetical protein GIB67_037625 [Kingdonia uniflora]